MSSYSYFSKMRRREITHNWAQFLAIIGIGAIAVTLFVGLESNATSLENRIESVYTQGKLPDLWVTTKTYDGGDLDMIKEAGGDSADYDSRFETFVQINKKNFYAVVKEELPTLSAAYEIDSTVDPANDYHYFLVDDTLLSNGGIFTLPLNKGDTVNVSFDISSYGLSSFASYLDPYLKEGASNIFKEDTMSLPFVISGSMKNPENIAKASYNTSLVITSNAYFHESFKNAIESNFNAAGESLVFQALQGLLGWGDGTPDGSVSSFPASNQYLVRMKDGASASSAKDKIKTAFEDKAEDNLLYLNDRDSMPFSLTMKNEAGQARSFCYVFPFVFFFTALLVILTTISQMILKERLQIGTLKALGVRKREIYGHYSGITLALVGLGTLIGEILGPIIIPLIMDNKYQIIYSLPSLNYTFPVLAGILTAVAFLLSGALVTIFVCHKEVKLKPAESMRDAEPKVFFHGIEKEKDLSSRALSVKMAFRNIVLDPVKSLMVVFGVMGCTALLACGFGIDDTVDYGISHDLTMVGNSDLTLNLSSNLTKSEFETKISSIDGVSSYEVYGNGASTITAVSSHKEITKYYYVLPNDPSRFSIGEFGTDKVAVSQKIASSIGVEVGDKVNFTIGSSSYSNVEVGLIYTAFSYHGVIVHAQNKIFEGMELKYGNAWVDVASGHTSSEVAKNAQEGIEGCTTSTHEDAVNQINDIVSGVKIMTGAVKVFAILLAIVVLYNLALLNFRERSRDIATLKVLGFSKNEIAASLLWETLSLTLVGVAIGLALGYPFLVLVMSQNTVDLVSYLYTITPLSYLYSFLLSFVVALIVNLWLSYRTGKVKMVESLKSVE